ncbi:MAG: hypothetical protein RI906_2196 [Pseudomonadota bacterium]
MQTPDDPLGWFSASYAHSRERLIAAVAAASLPVHHEALDIGQRGPKGETLSIDMLIIGSRRPRRAFVLASGTHGVEGFCGAAIQLQLASRQLTGLRLPDDCALVLLHALNPYGFAWLRRVNESNVDLNRNFQQRFDPTLCSPDYESLFECLNPPDLDPDAEARRQQQLKLWAAQYGERTLQRVIAEGQYRHPRGIQFGGHRPEASTQLLLDWVGQYLGAAYWVAWLDVHTGLGDSGACQLLTGASPTSPSYLEARRIWGESVTSVQSEASVSPPLHGLLEQGVARALAPGCVFAYAAPEFGTHPTDRVVAAFRADNWLHNYGNPGDAQGHAIKAEMLEAFRPAGDAWARAITRTGQLLCDQGLRALGHPQIS